MYIFLGRNMFASRGERKKGYIRFSFPEFQGNNFYFD